MSQPKPNACCNDEKNLIHKQIDKDRSVDVCQVCGCRHFRLKADPVEFQAAIRAHLQAR